MPRGELFFKDGSSLMGDYQIVTIGPGLKSLFFTTTKLPPIGLVKETDLLKSSTGVIVASGLVKKSAHMGATQTIVCEFIDKS